MKTIGYERLSHDDGDYDESSSIINQRKYIEEYAKEHGIHIDEHYTDDGISGYTMDRPDFNRLLNDLNNDEVDTIIVKNLSRIGRHNAKVQLFLENIAESGKRVIAIGDGYDTLDENSHDIVGIQTWVNEKYVRDGSKNVRKAIATMQSEGRYVSNVPYGYMLLPNTKGKYIVDETCAHYIKEIFDMYLNGQGTSKIATILTERGVPNSTMIAKERLERRGQVYRGSVSTRWYPNVILSILQNDFYIGTLTLGKTKRRSINGKRIFQKEENLYVFEDAHEPLIDKKTFKLVQDMIIERAAENYRGSKIQKRPNIFAGKLYCADCGYKMTSTGKEQNTRYVCKTYNFYGTSHCTSHIIHENELKEVLILFLKNCRDNLSEAINDLDNILKQNISTNSGNVISILESDLQRVSNEVKILLEQKMRETMANPMMKDIIDKTYSEMINAKYHEIQALNTQLEDCRKEQIGGNEIRSNLSSALKIFDDILETKDITKRQIATIVDKIIVHDDGGTDIFLKADMHELCTNYIQFKSIDKQKIIEATVEYIQKNPEKIMLSKADKYVRGCGNKIGRENYRRIFQILIDQGYVEPNPGYNKGFRVIDLDKLINDTKNYNVANDTPGVQKNNVTIGLIHKISKWVTDTMPKKKLLF